MLLDDDAKFVELIMENIMWGNVTINWNGIPEKERRPVSEMMGNYAGIHKKGSDDPELKELITKLATDFQAYRAITGAIIGELRDRDHENKIEQLTKDNKQLAERLNEAYIPPKDSKIGTT